MNLKLSAEKHWTLISLGIESVQLNKDELDKLAKKTKVIVNAVGPYHKYSTPVVEACANNGTHYLDVTGETPWVWELIGKYHETAKANGAIVSSCLSTSTQPKCSC